VCFDFLCVFVRNIPQFRMKSARHKCRDPHHSCQILSKLLFPGQILEKNSQILNFMKIRPVGAKLFEADRQMKRGRGMTNIRRNSRFSQFCKRAQEYAI